MVNSDMNIQRGRKMWPTKKEISPEAGTDTGTLLLQRKAGDLLNHEVVKLVKLF